MDNEPNGNELEAQPEATVTPEQPQQPPTPTAEEQLKTLQAELAQTKADRERLEKGYKGLQTNLNKSNEELKKQADLHSRIDALSENQKILAAMLAEKQVVSENPENIPQEKKTDILARFDAVQKQAEIKRQQQEYASKARSFQERTEALGLKEDDEEYQHIKDLVERTNFTYAEKILSRLEATKVKAETPATGKQETEEERIERLVQERLTKVQKDKGLLHTDTGLPSGKVRGKAEIIAAYANGEATTEEYEKAIRK